MKYKKTLLNLYSYLKKHFLKLFISILVMVLAAVSETLLPELLGRLIDALFVPNEASDNTKAIFFSILLLILITCSALFTFIATASNVWVTTKVIMEIRNKMFETLLYLPKKYYDSNKCGAILSKLTFDVEQIAESCSNIWIVLFKDSIIVIGLFIYLFYKNWQLSMGLFFIMPIIYYTFSWATKRIRHYSSENQKNMGLLTHNLEEDIIGNEMIKIYQAQKQEYRRFSKLTQTIRQNKFKIELSNAANIFAVYVIIGIILSSVVFFSSQMNMTAGDFLSFFTAMSMLIKPFKSLTGINKPIQQAVAAGDSVFSFINESREHNNYSLDYALPKKGITFDKVSFFYSKNLEKKVLKNISLTIKKGQIISLVGTTGSGKTTFIELLNRFYNPTEGEILIDGKDITKIDLIKLRNSIALVDQKNILFNDTIAYNIGFGNNDNISDEEIKNAAKLAQASDFIENLPNKFATKVGDNGANLSGGQKQRITIARALAKKPDILIMDEATSFLDNVTEKKIQDTLHTLKDKCTIILVTHRLRNITDIDNIFVFKNGQLVEQGSHKQLLKVNGEYSRLYASQK